MSPATIAAIVTVVLAIIKGIFWNDKGVPITESIASGEPVGPDIAERLRQLGSGEFGTPH